LNELAADAARLCHAREAVLSCGTQVIARWTGPSGARHVIATQPFGAGVEAYELNLFDEVQRELTETERGAFQAMTEAFQRELERSSPVTVPSEAGWVKDHVSVAIDYVSELFVLVLRDWTIQHVNTAVEHATTRKRSELVGRNFWDAFPQIIGTDYERELRQAMEGSVPKILPAYSFPSGRWFQSRAFPCKSGLAVLTSDITDRKTDEAARVDIEQKLFHAQRMESIGTLAGGIAHDFNNILSAILGHVGLMRDLLPARSAALESLEQIRIAGERARDLVQQILAYSRSTAREFVRQPVRPLLEESLRLLRSTLPASVDLRVTLTDEPLAATVNPSEVQQVVMNLCTNAWHAVSSSRGTVEVDLGRVELDVPQRADVGRLSAGLYARIRVRDTGSGMTEEVRSRLFEPFFTTKPRGHGTGLGLHVVQAIVCAHGGAIVVRTAPGKGSDFQVYLPATPSSEVEQAQVPRAREPLGHGERIAYVDDDEVVQLVVQRVLERAGFSVVSFSDPHGLLQAVANEPQSFDLLVTDYSMPGMNGLQLAREVRRSSPDIPVIIVTGFATNELKKAVAELGRAELVFKEYAFEQLGEQAFRALLAAPQAG
jgi:signal transduction histidine kinase